MKYEFHVGDYVVYSIGDRTYTGYVQEYKHSVLSDEHFFVFQWDKGGQLEWSGRIEELPYNLIRIGQYDFTKSSKSKIEPFQVNTALTEYASIFAMADKINELIEAVNRLKEKVNEMAQS